MRHGVGDGCLHGGLVADVAAHVAGLAAGGADRLDGLGAVGQVGDHHARALPGEQLGGDPAEPGRRARDEADLAVQTVPCRVLLSESRFGAA